MLCCTHCAAGINTLFFSTLYLADVSEEEARAYFFDHSLRQKPAAAAVLRACPEAWPAIFKARRPLRRAAPRRSGV